MPDEPGSGGPPLTLGPLTFDLAPAEFRQRALAEIERAVGELSELLDRQGPRTLEGFVDPLDRIVLRVRNVSNHGSLLFAGHPEEAGRTAGREVSETAEAFFHAFRLNDRLYGALRSVPLDGADPPTRFAIEKMLRTMRRAGVEKDPPTRQRLLELNREIDLLGNEYSENVANLVRGIDLDGPEELAGLPEDYRAAHPTDAAGHLRITTRYTDAFPVFKYADRAEVRRRLLFEFLRRAYPENGPVLEHLLERRFELAQRLGYPDFAALALEDRMLATPEAVRGLLDRVGALLGAGAVADRARFLERKRRSVPGADRLEPWDAAFFGPGYYDEKIRAEEFGVDLRQLRAYLPYGRVRDGLLELCRDLFGLEIHRTASAEVWHPTVEAYDVHREGRRIGRFFLDLAPRTGKFGHAACFNVREGRAGVELPQAALLCNMLEPGVSAEEARLEYSHLVTLFHEFGHLVHFLLSGQPRWTFNGATDLEWDFIEAPSQLFEEWARDPATLTRFAVDPDTGAPAPRELLERLAASNALGRANSYVRQVALSAISLDLHSGDPRGRDLARATRATYLRYFDAWPEEYHFETSFGHLVGYSAGYYTYVWSIVIARDLLRPFLEGGSLTDRSIAARYAREILAPGSERPAAESIRAFLGREFTFEAFERWALTPAKPPAG